MKFKGLIITIIFLVVTLIGVFLILKKREKKIAYVKLAEVYEKFDMTKEMENKFKQIELIRKNIIDSLEFNAKVASKDGDNTNSKYKLYVEEYINKRKEFEEANEELSKQLENQIWNQINSYCEVYGNDNNYEYIIGAQGAGILMYANPKNDITLELTTFINKAYNGKKTK